MKKISPDIILRIKPKTPWRTLEGTVVIIDPETYSCVTLNEVATFIWHTIDGKKSFFDIVTLITDEFDIDQAQAQSDAETLLKILIDKELIVEEIPSYIDS